MYKIVCKKELNSAVTYMEIEAPFVARKAKAGQFIIFRVDEKSERVPLTIAGYDREKGTVAIIFQKVGYTTKKLDLLNEGDALLDFVGPLGRALVYGQSGVENMVNLREFYKNKRVLITGHTGFKGSWLTFWLHEMGAEVDVIVGFRSTDLMILMDELKAASTNLYVMTDDGSNGHQGFVTTALEEQLKAGVKYDHVIAIGPLVMMRAVCKLTKEYNIPTIVSMNPIMIDGTGMCGCCRVTVDGKMKFACVDGPDFDGHEIDFDEAMSRSRTYADFEQHERDAACNLFKKEAE